MNSKYRKYDQNVPKYLVNRPAHFVKRCLIIVNIGKNADMTSNGEFIVHSFKDNREHYNVKFGTDDEMPSCSCSDWNYSMHLCKHFFAIFKYPDTWSWNTISSLYRNSPFLTMDEEITKENEAMTKEDENITKEDGEMSNEHGEIKIDKEMAISVVIEDGRMEREDSGKAMEDEGIKNQSNNLASIKLKDKDIEYGSMVRDVIGQLKYILIIFHMSLTMKITKPFMRRSHLL